MPSEIDPGKSVLLVEDEPIVARVAQAVLRHAGYRADCVGTGREAIARLEKTRYPIVILDLGLPDIDGRGVVLWLRHFEEQQKLPRTILVVTTSGAGDGQNLSALDVDAVLQEPLSVSAFLEAIECRDPVDFGGLLERASNDDALVREVLGDLLVVVAQERSALDAECKALAFRPTATRAHRLRGALLAVGANVAARYAGHLEQLAEQERDEELPGALASLDAALQRTTVAVEDFLRAA